MSSTSHVSIGQVKRDISELVNRVAYAGERIVLTSRGKPKAVLVSLEDFEQLQRAQSGTAQAWQAWLAESDRLSEQVLERRGGQAVDADAAWDAARADLEQRGNAGEDANGDGANSHAARRG